MDNMVLAQAEDLVLDVLKCTRLDPGLMSLVMRKTHGNPLFIKEYAHALKASGYIDIAENGSSSSRKASNRSRKDSNASTDSADEVIRTAMLTTPKEQAAKAAGAITLSSSLPTSLLTSSLLV